MTSYDKIGIDKRRSNQSPRLATHSKLIDSSLVILPCVILLGLPSIGSLYSFRCTATHDPRMNKSERACENDDVDNKIYNSATLSCCHCRNIIFASIIICLVMVRHPCRPRFLPVQQKKSEWIFPRSLSTPARDNVKAKSHQIEFLLDGNCPFCNWNCWGSSRRCSHVTRTGMTVQAKLMESRWETRVSVWIIVGCGMVWFFVCCHCCWIVGSIVRVTAISAFSSAVIGSVSGSYSVHFYLNTFLFNLNSDTHLPNPGCFTGLNLSPFSSLNCASFWNMVSKSNCCGYAVDVGFVWLFVGYYAVHFGSFFNLLLWHFDGSLLLWQ